MNNSEDSKLCFIKKHHYNQGYGKNKDLERNHASRCLSPHWVSASVSDSDMYILDAPQYLVHEILFEAKMTTWSHLKNVQILETSFFVLF